MPDTDDIRQGANFGIGVPQQSDTILPKGLSHLEWGMKDRLSRVFDRKSGKTVMLAFDHGFIMGPTSGLERIDLSIVPLLPYCDCVMCCRGILRSVVPPNVNKPISLRFDAGSTILTYLNEDCLLDIEEAVRLNASLLATMVAVGDPKFEGLTIKNLTRTVDRGTRYGIPTLGVTAVGKDLVRDSRYLSLATRVCAENGAHVVKTYYCEEGFEQVTNTCPVPIVIAGGKKLPELDALTMAYRAINEGAAGVDMGRNIFQSDSPFGMMEAIRAVVHNGEKPEKAIEIYQSHRKN